MRIKGFTASAFLSFLVFSASPAAAGTAKDCHIGSYRLSDARAVDIAPSDVGTLRWRMFTGETGQLHPHKDGISTRHRWLD